MIDKQSDDGLRSLIFRMSRFLSTGLRGVFFPTAKGKKSTSEDGREDRFPLAAAPSFIAGFVSSFSGCVPVEPSQGDEGRLIDGCLITGPRLVGVVTLHLQLVPRPPSQPLVVLKPRERAIPPRDNHDILCGQSVV